MSDVTVDADRFGAELRAILGRLDDAVEGKVLPAVRDGAKVARKEWRSNARSSFGGTGAYAGSITYRVRSKGGEVSAEIGSAALPGLPHLLEKGHAKVGGGRVPGRKHIAPAADDAFQATEESFDRLVDEAIAEAAS